MDEINNEIVWLKDKDGLTFLEIAQRLGLTRDAVSGRYRRTKESLSSGNVILSKGGQNIKEITIPSGVVVRTLEELIDFCEINLGEWGVIKWVANWWGNRENPNTQIKAWLARLEPVAIQPVIQPVVIKMRKTPAYSNGRAKTEIRRALVLFDPHFGFSKSLRSGDLTPFHDRGALDVALRVAQSIKPDIVVFGGDILDLADWSDKFARSPNMYWTTQPSALEAAWWIAQFRMVSDRVVVIPGNHDDRMDKAIINHLKEAYGLRSVDGMELPPLLSIPRLLGLHSMDVEYIGEYPTAEVWINDRVAVEHGDLISQTPGGTAGKMIKDAQYTKIFGHVHRIELATKTLRGRDGSRSVSSFCPGCLCYTDGRVPGSTPDHNWQQGIGIIDYLESGEHWLHSVPMNDGKAMFEGRFFESWDRVEELKEATGWGY